MLKIVLKTALTIDIAVRSIDATMLAKVRAILEEFGGWLLPPCADIVIRNSEVHLKYMEMRIWRICRRISITVL
jgi:hypothetical protein